MLLHVTRGISCTLHAMRGGISFTLHAMLLHGRVAGPRGFFRVADRWNAIDESFLLMCGISFTLHG
jgi:hypothetical protein